MKRRLRIALFTCHLDNEFSKRVYTGCSDAAEEMDVDLFIFPVRTLDAVYDYVIHTNYEYQYNNLFCYAKGNNFDAIIVETGTVGSFVTQNRLRKILSRFQGIPVVTVAGEVNGYPCVRFARKEFKQIVLHLICQHNCKRVAYVGGPKTNQDSIERFESYREALEMQGLEFRENLVAEGDFSEYSNKAVFDLFERNPEGIDAICFANDRMAIGGYEEIARRGLIVGRDILVTGFDDAQSAVTMNPPLTTVRADCASLGYQAVEECIRLINGGKQQPIISSTRLIRRESCGCRTKIMIPLESWDGTDREKEVEIETFLEEINIQYFDSFLRGPKEKQELQKLEEWVRDVFKWEVGLRDCDEAVILEEENRLLHIGMLEFVSIEEINRIVTTISDKAVQMNGDETRIRIIQIEINKAAVKYYYDTSYLHRKKQKDDIRLANTIMDKMLGFDFNLMHDYREILAEIKKMGMEKSFFFFNRNPVLVEREEDWEPPREEVLLFYQEGDEYNSVDAEKRYIATDSLFCNEVFLKERGSYIVSPLFFGKEHYGLVVCETKPENYYYFSYVIVPQTAYAIKYFNIMKDQLANSANLEENLIQEKNMNEALSIISKTDELTGLYNRRGFMDFLEEKVHSPKNRGLIGTIFFADLDNLKKINDIYGHEEGDNALRLSAYMLKKCMKNTDVIARFGGDEFVTFTLVQKGEEKAILEQLENIMIVENAKSGKEYYVEMSIGVYSFECREDVSLKELLKLADSALYKDKSLKRQEVSKKL